MGQLSRPALYARFLCDYTIAGADPDIFCVEIKAPWLSSLRNPGVECWKRFSINTMVTCLHHCNAGNDQEPGGI